MINNDPTFIECQKRKQVKSIIEALLFTTSAPISFNKIREITDSCHVFRPSTLLSLIRELQVEYSSQQRAFQLVEVAEGFVMQTDEEYSEYIDQLFTSKRTEKLSQAATEVLAIIAYRQPITRPQIESIRGVDSSGTIHSLLERGLIESAGRLEAPGRPALYNVTEHFLRHFGIKTVEDLKIKSAS